jgi:hypothetical protein
VKLIAGTRFVRAHRSILAAASQFMADLFVQLDPFQVLTWWIPFRPYLFR